MLVHYMKFDSMEQFLELAEPLEYVKTYDATGDTVIDVPGPGFIDVVGTLYDESTRRYEIDELTGEEEPVDNSATPLPGWHLNIVYRANQELPESFLPFKIDPPTNPAVPRH